MIKKLSKLQTIIYYILTIFFFIAVFFISICYFKDKNIIIKSSIDWILK